MGTVENIVTNLAKMGQDKRAQASQRYNELSAWLTHEVSLISALIESSPRNSSFGTASEGKAGSKGKGKAKATTTATAKSKADTDNKNTASSSSASATAASSKSDSNKDAEKEKFQRQKRKSPETRQTGTSQSESPDQKRTSLDYEELAVKAGLPADLNRLRKEQLLNELEKRGCMDFTMKSLKKELIDGLRNILAENKNHKFDSADILVGVSNDKTEIEEEVANTPAVPTSLPESTTNDSALNMPDDLPPAPTSVRSSLLSSMRNSLGKPVMSSSPEVNQEQLQERAAHEFEARQSRSQLRKSVADNDTTVDEASEAPPVPAEVVEDSENTNESIQAAVEIESVEQKEDPSENHVDVNKYSSPAKVSPQKFDVSVVKTPAPEETVDTSSPSPNKDDAMAISPAPSVPVFSGNDEVFAPVQEVVTKSPTYFQEDGLDSRISAVSESSAESCAAATDVSTQKEKLFDKTEETVQSNAPVVNAEEPQPQKKPLNLVSNQTSFLPGAKPKTVIPALQQAARAKEAEAAKALQREAERKRKEQEAKDRSAKPAVPQAASVHGAKPVSNLSKSNLLKPTTTSSVSKSTHSNTTSTSKSNVAAAVKSKGGIMGFIKKTFTTTTPSKEKTPETPDASEAAYASKEGIKASPKTTIMPAASAPVQQSAVPVSTTTASAQKSASEPVTATSVPAPIPVSAPTSVSKTLSAEVTHTTSATKPASEKKVAIQAPAEVEYEIEDRSSSGSDDSGTDDDREDRRKNTIPDWARGAQLKEALEKQFGFHGHTPMDPDSIFYEVSTCSLEEIFGQKEGRTGRAYAGRSSSAKWDADEISVIERRKYRQQMGYANTTPVN